jgi:hypothetical protein
VNKPNLDTLSAIVSLENDHNWQEIVRWIDESLTAQLEQLTDRRGEETHIFQGRCVELKQLLGTINGAREGIESAKKEAAKDRILSGGRII